jgi:CBS domain-containing protein
LADKGEHAVKQDPVAAGCFHSAWQMMNADTVPGEEVACYMTADPVTAPADALVGDLARMMVDAHIHRIVVVDEEDRPAGIVSSTDILAAVAYASARLPKKG